MSSPRGPINCLREHLPELHRRHERRPTDACQTLYECERFRSLLRPSSAPTDPLGARQSKRERGGAPVRPAAKSP